MSKRKKNNGITAVAEVLSSILIVLLAVGIAASAIALLVKIEKGFYVEYDGKQYQSATDDKIPLPVSDKYNFSVGLPVGDTSNCSVTVRANSDSTLTFSADEVPHEFFTGISSFDDYTKYFDISVKTDTVTLSFPQNASIENALKFKYNTENIVITSVDDVHAFELVFAVDDDEVIFTFGVSLEYLGVSLNPPSIMF